MQVNKDKVDKIFGLYATQAEVIFNFCFLIFI
jgi:hypothetical protein